MSEMLKRYYRARGIRIPDNDNWTPAWQRVEAEQAAYYGMTVPQHRRFLANVCGIQERAEFEQWEA